MRIMLIWLGAGSAPPDLVAESAEREREGARVSEEAFPASKDWMRGE